MEYPSVTLGRVEAVWNKLGGEEGVDRFLRGELAVAEPIRSWQERDGVIYFTVTSDGTSGEEWIARLERKGLRFSKYAKDVLRSSKFKPTNGVTTDVAVLKGMLWSDDQRITSNIRADAERRKFTKPNAEVACLIREKFSDEEIEAMGLIWLVTMHEPIADSGGDLSLLGASRRDVGRWLLTCDVRPGLGWGRDCGFAVAVAQVSA